MKVILFHLPNEGLEGLERFLLDLFNAHINIYI